MSLPPPSPPSPPEEGFFDKLKRHATAAADAVATQVKKVVPTGAQPAVSDPAAIKTLGAAREKKGCTITGGRRYRKKGKKARKTKRRSRR